jgi:hypothetical protein
MTDQQLEHLTEQVEKLSPDEQLMLIERIAALLRTRAGQPKERPQAEDETWDEEELRQLLNDNHPMTTQEIVEAGLFGGWEDMGIEDSLVWVEQQRAKTRNRYSW